MDLGHYLLVGFGIFLFLCIKLFNTDHIIGGMIYPTYGFINGTNNRDPNIYYSVGWWKIIFILLSIQTVVIPLFILATCIMIPRYKKS